MKYVKIPLEEYKRLIKSDFELNALEAMGVDNWSGYGEHRDDTYEESLKEILSEEEMNKVIVNE